jgi:flagellar hook-associated protein 1 FlgK
VDGKLKAQTDQASALSQQVADLNQEIINSEAGSGGQSNGLRDQRDAVLKKLSELVDIKTVERDAGVCDVLRRLRTARDRH